MSIGSRGGILLEKDIMNLLTTLPGSLMEGFLPAGWDLARIDKLAEISSGDLNARRPWWHAKFDPVACASLADFETYKGYDARIELDRLAENRKRFKGVLAGVTEGQVAIDLEGEDETVLVPFPWISDAKLVITDRLLKRGAEARAQRVDREQEEQSP